MASLEAILSPRAWIAGVFFEKLHEAFMGSFVSDITTLVQSNQQSETYKWLDDIPGLVEWTGPRPLDGISSLSYTLENKTFTAGIKLDRSDMRRDVSGQIAIRIGELAVRTAQHAESLLTTRIEENGNAYDGNAFFGDTHVSPVFDNAVTHDVSNTPVAERGLFTAPSPGTAGYSIMTGIKTLLGAKDSQGLPLNPGARNFGCMVPVRVADAYLLATSANTLEGGGSNPLMSLGGNFKVDVVVNPYLSSTFEDTESIVVWNKDSQVKPYIYQVEEAPRFDFLGEGSEQAIMNRAHLALSEWSGNIGYGRFTSAVRVTLVA